jgi:hypothetical protein
MVRGAEELKRIEIRIIPILGRDRPTRATALMLPVVEDYRYYIRDNCLRIHMQFGTDDAFTPRENVLILRNIPM